MKRTFAFVFLAVTTAIAFSCTKTSGGAADNPDVANNGTLDAPATTGTLGPDVAATSTAPSGSCPSAVIEDSLPVWVAPKTGTHGACSSAQIKQLVANVATEDVGTLFDSLNPTTAEGGTEQTIACQECVFSNQADPNWQVFVCAPTGSDSPCSDGAFLNYGACYALAPGGTAACGKAVETEKLCQIAACPDSCTNVEECFASADESVCGAEANTTQGSCGAALNSVQSACSDLEDVLTVVCGGEADAGSGDASTD